MITSASTYLYAVPLVKESIRGSRLICRASAPIMFRVEDGRQGLEKDNSCNYSIRIYMIKEKNMREIPLVDKDGFVSPALMELVKKDVLCALKGVKYYCKLKGEDSSDPKRLQVCYEKDELYYSIVIGYRFDDPKNLSIGDFRYFIPIHMVTFSRVFFVNNYHTHLPISGWDVFHLEKCPLREFRLSELSNFLKKLEVSPASIKPSLDPSVYRNINNELSDPDVEKTGDEIDDTSVKNNLLPPSEKVKRKKSSDEENHSPEQALDAGSFKGTNQQDGGHN